MVAFNLKEKAVKGQKRDQIKETLINYTVNWTFTAVGSIKITSPFVCYLMYSQFEDKSFFWMYIKTAYITMIFDTVQVGSRMIIK